MKLFKRLVFLLVVTYILIGLSLISFAKDEYIPIRTTEDLRTLLLTPYSEQKEVFSKHYKLMNDIDMRDYKNFIGIGNEINRFSGTFDGQGFEISNLTEIVGEGIFNSIDTGGVVKNIKISNSTLNGKNGREYGIIASKNLGVIDNVQLINCNLTTIHNNAGIIAGNNNGSISNITIIDSNLEFIGSNRTSHGGVVGLNGSKGTIKNAYFNGKVIGNIFAGGIVGINYGEITNVYSEGEVFGKEKIGGIAGRSREGSKLSFSIANANVISKLNTYKKEAAPVVGYNYSPGGTHTWVYFNKDNKYSAEADNIMGIKGVSTLELKEMPKEFKEWEVFPNINGGFPYPNGTYPKVIKYSVNFSIKNIEGLEINDSRIAVYKNDVLVSDINQLDPGRYTYFINAQGYEEKKGIFEIEDENKYIKLVLLKVLPTIKELKLEPSAETIFKGSYFSLPTKAVASMSDNTTKNVEITWDKEVNINTIGIQKFIGTVEGWTGNIIFTLTVEEVMELDKSELEKLIEESEKLLEEDYTANSFIPFKEAIEKAKLLLVTENITKEEVIASYKNLLTIKNNLKPIETAREYSIRIIGAKASKSKAKAGEIITIESFYSNFLYWSCNVDVVNKNSARTQFTMPERDVEIEALRRIDDRDHYRREIVATTPVPMEATKVEMLQVTKISIDSKTLLKIVGTGEIKIEMDVAAYIKDNRTMLPLRYIGETLGFEVKWEEAARIAVLKNKELEIKIPVDSNSFTVNKKEYKFDTQPEIKNNRLMLSISNIAKALGLKEGKEILWDSNSREVTIYKKI